MELTEKQREIMRLVLAVGSAGSGIEFWDLKARLSYGAGVSPQAIQCSIRYLEAHGLVDRLYGYRNRLEIVPTAKAYCLPE